MTVHNETNHAACAFGCQSNSVRVTLRVELRPEGAYDGPALCPASEKRGEIVGLEAGFSTLEEEIAKSGEADPFSSDKTSAQLPSATCPLPDWLKGFLLWLRDGSKVCPSVRPVQGYQMKGKPEPALRRKKVAPALFLHRNPAFVFSMIGVAIIMVKLLSGGVKPARQQSLSAPKQKA